MMDNFSLKRLWLDRDARARHDWEWLLSQAQLSTTEPTDYTVAFYHESGHIAATGSLEGNVLKCLVVSALYQSENLMTQLVMVLLEAVRERGFTRAMVYTKPSNGLIFRSLGFRLIVETETLILMEQGTPTFQHYLAQLPQPAHGVRPNSAIVMNANPFTLGHLFLVETAAATSEWVYIFVVAEDKSYFTANDRLAMVQKGVAHLGNVTVLSAQDYMVSSATFPAYFLKDRADLAVAQAQAILDATLFKTFIAPILYITRRYVGQEPDSPVTAVYNHAMATVFGEAIEFVELPRYQVAHTLVSASRVRQAIATHDLSLVQQLVPNSTYQYLVTHDLVNDRGDN